MSSEQEQAVKPEGDVDMNFQANSSQQEIVGETLNQKDLETQLGTDTVGKDPMQPEGDEKSKEQSAKSFEASDSFEQHERIETQDSPQKSKPESTNDDELVEKSHSSINSVSQEDNQSKINEILALKAKITTLVANIRDTKQLSEKFENENQYLQDYFGSLMKSGELK